MRERLLRSRRFQRLALAFPPTRWIARRRARHLFDLCAGFVYSQVLTACVQLEVFRLLADGPRELALLARSMSLSETAAGCLLEAARSLGLVKVRRNGAYALADAGAILDGDPGLRAMVEHHHLLYADLADPVALLRGSGPGRLRSYWAYADTDDDRHLGVGDVAPYTALMSASQTMVAAEILDAGVIRGHRHVLDIGGGDGSFLAHVGARVPDVRLTLFDLPSVVAIARANPALARVSDRLSFAEGDFRTDPLPRGADLATLVRVLHDHDDAVVLALLRAARAALASGGKLLVAEPMADLRGAGRGGQVYFGLYLLAMGQGRPRSQTELARLLAEAGFRSVEPVRTRLSLVTGALLARV